MEYFISWSGKVRGMRKCSIPAVKAKGFLSDNGLAPCKESLREAIPHRLRKALDRANLSRRTDAISVLYEDPLFYSLYDCKGKWITNIYLHPFMGLTE